MKSTLNKIDSNKFYKQSKLLKSLTPDPPTPSNRLAPLDLGPEEQIIVEDLEVTDKDLSPTSFPNRRSYLLRRKYQYQTPEGNVLKVESQEYLIVFINGNVYMGYNTNANKPNNPTLQLKELNVGRHCRKLVLQGDSLKPLPVCVQCLDFSKFYLRDFSAVEKVAKVCVPRVRKTQFCAEYDRFSEKCVKCSEKSFLFTDTEIEICLPGKDSCEQHKVVERELVCVKCVEDKVLVAGSCQPQAELKNCRNREDNSCLTCEEGFLLFGKKCVSRMAYSFFKCSDTALESKDQNENLEEPSKSKNNQHSGKCDCGSDGLEIEEAQTCEAIGADKCREYDHEDQCVQCREGYYMSPSLVCLEGEIAFCKVYAAPVNGVQVCKMCEQKYVLENNTCRPTLEIFSRNCEEADGEMCIKCAKGAYSVGLNISPTTTIQNKLTTDSGSEANAKAKQPILSNRHSINICAVNVFYSAYSGAKDCLIFNSHTMKCELCKDNLWVDPNGDCSVCNLTTHAIDNRNSHCVIPPSRLKGCELYDGDFCVKCIDLEQPRILDEKLYTTLSRVYSSRNENRYTDSAGFVIRECGVKLGQSCNTEHCENAVRLEADKVCCQKCKHGRAGAWSEANGMFYTKSCQDLVQYCDASALFKEIPIEFSKYLTCHKCLEGRVTQLNLTEGQVQTRCIEKPNDPTDLASCLIVYEGECRVCEPASRQIFQAADADTEPKLTCQPIAECAFSKTVGRCDTCANGFSLDSTGENCVPSPIQNCFELNIKLICIKCRNGLILRNGKCFALTQANCTRFKGADCVSCLTNNDDSLQNQPDPSTLMIIKLNLRKTDQLTSWKKSLCISPSDSQSSPKLDNCINYISASLCAECAPGFILQRLSKDSIKCVLDPKAVADCHRLDSEGRCLECREGRFLEGDRCFDGQIAGCLRYASQLNCKECKPKFTRLHKEKRALCFLSHPLSRCLKPDILQNLKSGRLAIKCERCEPLYRKKISVLSENRCFPLRVRPNCREFDSDSGHCRRCDDLFFVNSDFFCQKRLNLGIRHCKSLKEDGDSCGQCHSNYSLGASSLECVQRKFPLIPGCKIQNNSDFNCRVCDSEHFREASQGICFPVLKSVVNCAGYASPDLCSVCRRGYKLVLQNEAQICKVILGVGAESGFEIVPKTIWIKEPVAMETKQDLENSQISQNTNKTANTNDNSLAQNSDVIMNKETQIEVQNKNEKEILRNEKSSTTNNRNPNLDAFEALTLQDESIKQKKQKQKESQSKKDKSQMNVFEIFEDENGLPNFEDQVRLLSGKHPLHANTPIHPSNKSKSHIYNQLYTHANITKYFLSNLPF